MTTRIRQITDHERLFIGQKMMLLRHFELYPTGILSEVMDTWDLWQVLTELLPDPEIKAAILARDGKLVIRPDSGDPVDIICGRLKPMDKSAIDDEIGDILVDGVYYKDNGFTNSHRWEPGHVINKNPDPADVGVVELLWDIFGGKINEYGYKELDPHIGAIYGDSITIDRADEICKRLKAKGFASTNIVFGVGSYTYQYNTRDTFGFAVKATYGELRKYNTEAGYHDEFVTEAREIWKDPITDDGTKKSAKGLLFVGKNPDGTLYLKDQASWDEYTSYDNLLQPVFRDGVLLIHTSFDQIRERVAQGL